MYSHFFKLILSLAVAATLAYFIVGFTGLLAVTCLLLLGWLAWHLYQISRLYRWLKNPKLNTLPRARSGVWGDIFDTLLSQAKSRKKRKQKLSSALLHLNRLTEALPNGVLLLDAQGRIEWLNRPAAQHLNLDLTRDHQGILKNLIRSPEFHAFLQATADQQPDIHISLHGRSILITRTAFDKDQTLLVSQDITAIERLNTTRSDFVANVSHELRTPAYRNQRFSRNTDRPTRYAPCTATRVSHVNAAGKPPYVGFDCRSTHPLPPRKRATRRTSRPQLLRSDRTHRR